MDFVLTGRTVALCGPPGGVLDACRRALTDEGAVITDDGAPTDIVIAAGTRRPGSQLLSLDGPDSLYEAGPNSLYEAWNDAISAIEQYRAALPLMTERKWGRFVYIGTAQAKSLDSEADELATLVSMGMLGLHKVVASEVGGDNITANAVLRGGPATDDDVAATVAFLCSEGAAYLTGTTIIVDGGAGSAMF
ncbi:MAG: short-chain dehydrogenase [Pseudonocardiales bacterium]|nr:short-chain dehydrogenase [Pseudonocardiales bacterium]